MGVYGKRRDLEGGILVGLFRGEVYCDGVFLASRSMGPDGRKTEPSNRTFVIRRPPAAPEVDPAVQRPDAYPVPTEGEYPGIVTDGPVLPERDLGERLQEFAESGEHLVLLLDRLPGAPITPSNLAEGKNGHLCREPEGPPDTMIPSGLEPTVRELPLRKGNRRGGVAGRIVPLHRGEQQPSFVGRRKQPQLSHRLHTPSRLALARYKEYPREVNVYRDMWRADSSHDSSRGNPQPVILNGALTKSLCLMVTYG